MQPQRTLHITDDYDRLSFESTNKRTDKTTRTHKGQLKLAVSFLDFICYALRNYYPDKNEKELCHKKIFVIYVGSSPGNYLKIMLDLFPSMELWTYDPRGMDPAIKREYPSKDRFKEHRQFFKDSDANSCSKEVANRKREKIPTCFISDIRKELKTKNDYERVMTELQVIEDMLDQQRWAAVVGADYSQFKFRLPYSYIKVKENTYNKITSMLKEYSTASSKKDNIKKLAVEYLKPEKKSDDEYMILLNELKYFGGEDTFIVKQLFAPETTTETRLYVPFKNLNILKVYDNKKYEEQLFYHNNVIREMNGVEFFEGDKEKYNRYNTTIKKSIPLFVELCNTIGKYRNNFHDKYWLVDTVAHYYLNIKQLPRYDSDTDKKIDNLLVKLLRL